MSYQHLKNAIDTTARSIKDRKMREERIAYEMRSHARARRISITVYADGRVVVTKPAYVPDFVADLYIQNESKWIQEAVSSGI